MWRYLVGDSYLLTRKFNSIVAGTLPQLPTGCDPFYPISRSTESSVMRFLPTLPTRDDIKPYLAGKEAWVLPKEESALAPDHVWTNADLDPVAPAGRTWTTMDFFMCG